MYVLPSVFIVIFQKGSRVNYPGSIVNYTLEAVSVLTFVVECVQ